MRSDLTGQGAENFCSKSPLGVDSVHLIPRVFIRQGSGRHLNLLDPSPDGWTDEDLAIGLARTFRWGAQSTWPWPLSVAQHSLTVLALYKATTHQQAMRELLHDADEALIGGFDPVSPLKPLLGPAFFELTSMLQAAVATRYKLLPWTATEHKRHKHCDVLAAASEAFHVAGWSADEILDLLNIGLKPLAVDPLAELYDCRPWEPWSIDVAAERFFVELQGSGAAVLCGGKPETAIGPQSCGEPTAQAIHNRRSN